MNNFDFHINFTIFFFAAANNQNNELNLGDDGQWNPMEWDRAAEELTWERLLGTTQSEILRNFLPLRFYVKSILIILNPQKLPFGPYEQF